MTTKKKKITSGGLFNQPQGGNTIILMPPQRWHKDISDYRRSLSDAEKIDFPSRVRLYDLYMNVLQDAHLTAVMERLKAAILADPVEFSRDGAPDKHVGEMLASPWFRNFVRDLLDTKWWGFSLFQFFTDKSGWLTYELVPRKHVDPVREIILRHQTDIMGTPWKDYPDLLAVGEPRDIGSLSKAIPWVLYKQGAVSDWAQFCEIFGMPIREYVYPGEDEDERRRVANDAYNQGSMGVFIHSENSSMKLVESAAKSASGTLYRDMVNTCNAELSKLVLGNTLTTEASERGTQALGTVQKKGEDMIIEAEREFILDVLNYQMTDLLESFGINVRGGKFAYATPADTPDLERRIQIDMRIASLGIEIPTEYWYEAYGIPRPEKLGKRKETDKKPETSTEDPPAVNPEPAKKTKGKKGKKPGRQTITGRLRDFF
jgi:phage gp29-like protein